MRYFLDTQLYSYLANGTIAPAEWRAALAGRELWLSPVTVYELLEGLLKASVHTFPISIAALATAAEMPDARILPYPGIGRDRVRRWLEAAGGELPADFHDFRRSIAAGRAEFLAAIRRFLTRALPRYHRAADPLFSADWQKAAGRTPGEHLDAAFVFHTAVLERVARIRYNAEKHPSDYLDYLQLRYLNDEDLSFLTADRKLVIMTQRSLESDRIYLWSELANTEPSRHGG